jgi:hypothetical protein
MGFFSGAIVLAMIFIVMNNQIMFGGSNDSF